ncbi:MAG: aspartate kinase [Chloroflexi bacterium]|nr:aspartate kinase [Chloroflexota bacterium]
MSLIVQKYGGKSLADADKIRQVSRRIATAREQGNQVVVVVSAMGGSTDGLIQLAGQITDSPDSREMDVLLSTGELVSCALVVMALQTLGEKAISLSGFQAGIRTDTGHRKAKIASIASDRVKQELDKGNIVVIAGFQGITDSMDITTLGRGGSDTTAVALAAQLEAVRCEIYTDVDGIYTANPKFAPKARRLNEIEYDEMLELASYGAKMEPRSIEIAMHYGVPVLIASSLTEGPGTLIHRGADMTTPSKRTVGELRQHVRSIAVDKNVAEIAVLGINDRPGIAAAIFEPLAEANVSVDIIVSSSGSEGTTDFSFTVKEDDLKSALKIVEPVAKEIGCRSVSGSTGLAKISIVGTGMQDAPGYAAKMFRALSKANINIDVITTSEIRITCLVDENKVEEAVRVLHDTFELDKVK